MSGVTTAHTALPTGSVLEWMSSKGISPEVARKANVSFGINRVIYPRYHYDGKLLGYKIRELNTSRMYNMPSGIAHRDTVPFTARHGKKELVICEGETDALALASSQWEGQFEDPHIIGVPGANAFPNEWAGYYSWADEIYLVPDPDDAGEQMVNKICGLLPRAKVVRLPDGMDLSDCIVEPYCNEFIYFSQAEPVLVTKKIRHHSYDFVKTADVDHSKLLDFVLMDTKLRRRGNEFVGLCPFHDEDTPSFMVNPKKNLFFCHGCKKGGDVISYVRNKYQVSFKEAKDMINK